VTARRYRDGWFKVSRRITESSLWAEEPVVLKVWLYLLEQAQAGTSLKPGTVIISRPILAARCLLTMEQLDAAIARLAAPDPESRTPRAEGRRLVVLPNGFRLVNHGEYHDADAAANLSLLRSQAGKLGAERSNAAQQAKRNQRFESQQNDSKPPASDQQTETEKETREGDREQTTDKAAIAALSGIPPAPPEERLSRRFVQVFNAAFGRRLGESPEITRRVRELLREYKGWQILALPLLSRANGDDEWRRIATPQILLRDGKHGRTTRAGYTTGAVNHLERELQRIDQTTLDARLTAVAAEVGITHKLREHGAQLTEAA
jgi:hypothetical protein